MGAAMRQIWKPVLALALWALLGRGAFCATDSPAAGGGTNSTRAKDEFFDASDAPPEKPKKHTKQAARQVDAVKGRRPVGRLNPTNTLGLSYWIELDAGHGTTTQVTAARVFHSGERIRLHFRSNTEGYVMLVQVGASGTAGELFPNPEKGLFDSHLAAGQDRVLPQESSWFRFDNQAGTERLLAFFARKAEELEAFPVRPRMDSSAAQTMVASTEVARGSKDLFIETETEKASEVGTYAVNTRGKPIVLEILLKHR
jgi:hypothetical protein